MNVNIFGSGQIAPGQYDTVRISGSGKLEGLVRCNAFSSSGASRGAELECSGAVKISGSSSFTRGIQAGELSVTGALSCGNDLQVSRELNCSGSLECGGSLRCNSLKLSGEAEVDGDVEAEAVKVSGSLDCTGLLNAETVLITGAGMRIGSIGGGSITIHRAAALGKMAKLPLLSTIIKTISGKVEVSGSIEGDSLELENVHCPCVSGRVVVIGPDCRIDVVQYSESVEISPKATVGRSEQI